MMMMKKGLFAVISLTAIFSLAMLGCDNGNKGGSKSDEARLSSLKVGVDGGAIELQSSRLGDPNAEWVQADPGTLALPVSQTQNAKVEPTARDADAKFRYAVAKSESEAPAFANGNTFTFADEDILYVEVTAPNGSTKLVYMLKVTIGKNTTLAALKVGGTDAEEMPTAVASLEDAKAATGTMFLIPEMYAGSLYAVAATLEDSEATVKFAKATGDEDPDFGDEASFAFADDDLLYIEVTAANGTNKAYYKLHINFVLAANIHYGKPEIKAASEQYIDPLWTTLANEEYFIKRPAPENSANNPGTTNGVAKALWDEDGLYLYVRVYDEDVANADLGAHMSDSVELFINENWRENADGTPTNTGGHAQNGGQYRIGANGTLTGDGSGQALAFQNLGKSSAWKTDDGYIVIFQAPWYFKETWPLADMKKIGFEMQINDSSSAGNDRSGVFVWNNTKSQSYGNVTDYTSATLHLDGHTLPVAARAPTITAQPQGAAYDVEDVASIAALSVTATSPDGGTLSYQWYSAESAAGAGTIIDGATSSTYTPDGISEAGMYYFYCAVTNTIAEATEGFESRTLNSARAVINITAFVMEEQGFTVEKAWGINNTYMLYQFVLPAGYTWGDFDKLTAEYMMDAENLAAWNDVKRESRLMGPYKASDISLSGGAMLAAFDDKNAAFIIDNTSNPAATLEEKLKADTWVEFEYDLSETGAHANFANMPDDNDTGPFYFGVGIPQNGGDEAAFVYSIRKVTLSSADGSTYLVSTGSGFEQPAFAGYATSVPESGRELVAEYKTDEEGTYVKVGLPVTATPEPLSGNWAGYTFELTLPPGFDIADYSKVYTHFVMIDSADDTVYDTGNIGTLKFFDSYSDGYNPQDAVSAADGPVLFSAYNSVGKKTNAISWGKNPGALRVEQGNDGKSYLVEVKEVRFYE